MTLERRYVELREVPEGRTLRGPVVVYGDVATIGDRFRERVEAGAFELADDLTLTIAHERREVVARTGAGLTVTDTPEAMQMVADLPVTPRADQLLADVRSRLLRGISVEMAVLRDRFEGALRIVERARLIRLSVVDSGAYPQSIVEAREALLEAAEPPKGRRGVLLWP